MLTDVKGIFADYQEPASLISSLQVDRAYQMITQGKIEGGMIPKVEACITALKAGVNRTHIIDGRQLHSLLLEILTDKGKPSERGGRKATDLKVIQVAYGGWVAEIG